MGALDGKVGSDFAAWGSVMLMAGWGVVNSQWAWDLLHGHMRSCGIWEHWGGARLDNFVCVWRPGLVDWTAWEDLVGLLRVGSVLGCVFGAGMVRQADLLSFADGDDLDWAGWEVG